MTRLTQQEYLDKANKKHGIDTYDYSLTVYNGSKNLVSIICKNHGIFRQKATSHADDGAGCPKCATQQYIKNKTLTTEEFISRARKVHEDRYDYSKTAYSGRSSKVVIGCSLHGYFTQKAQAHSQGAGCILCAREELAESRKISEKEWVIRCEAVHGDTYEYLTNTIKGRFAPISIKCKLHGLFTQTLSNHLKGSGCPACAKSGYNPVKNGTLYVIQFGEITKVGVTNRKVSARIRNLKTESQKTFKEIYSFTTDGLTALNIEKQILKELSSLYKPVLEKFSGYTECFYNVDVAQLINRIEELKENKWQA